jgi:hypothetical protein
MKQEESVWSRAASLPLELAAAVTDELAHRAETILSGAATDGDKPAEPGQLYHEDSVQMRQHQEHSHSDDAAGRSESMQAQSPAEDGHPSLHKQHRNEGPGITSPSADTATVRSSRDVKTADNAADAATTENRHCSPKKNCVNFLDDQAGKSQAEDIADDSQRHYVPLQHEGSLVEADDPRHIFVKAHVRARGSADNVMKRADGKENGRRVPGNEIDLPSPRSSMSSPSSGSSVRGSLSR